MVNVIVLLVAWLVASAICYFLFLAFYRRSPSGGGIQQQRRSGALPPSIRLQTPSFSSENFVNDLLIWLIWGDLLDESASNSQRLAPIFTRFLSKALNECSQRLHKDGHQEVHFDLIRLETREDHPLARKEAMFRDLLVHPNQTPGNHLSISAYLSTSRSSNGPIVMHISAIDEQPFTVPGGAAKRQENENSNQEQQNGWHQPRKVPTLSGPSVQKYAIVINALSGEIETRLASIAGELFVISCFKGRPDVQLELKELDELGQPVEDSEQLRQRDLSSAQNPAEEESNWRRKTAAAFLEEHVRRCIIGAVLNFSVGELLYPDAESSVRASRARLSAEYRSLSFLQEVYAESGIRHGQEQLPTNSSQMSNKFPLNDEEAPLELHLLQSANRLRIQLIEARDMETFQSPTERPFVCVELDEPSSERFLSPKAHLVPHNRQQQQHHQQRRSAFWSENEAKFELCISPASGELLFEVFSEDEHSPALSTVRERRFLGMGIMSLGELRQIVQQQKGLVRLQLQGRPEPFRERTAAAGVVGNRHRGGEQAHHYSHGPEQCSHGVLIMKCSFHHRQQIERPSAPRPGDQSPLLAAEYAQIKRTKRVPPSPSSPVNDTLFAFPPPQTSGFSSDSDQQQQQQQNGKKTSTATAWSRSGSSGSRRGLTRQKQHYIYNVTDDEGMYDHQYESPATSSKQSPSKSPPKPTYERAKEEEALAYNGGSRIGPPPVTQIRKTISENTNALLFQFEGGDRVEQKQKEEGERRKKSAPEPRSTALVIVQSAGAERFTGNEGLQDYQAEYAEIVREPLTPVHNQAEQQLENEEDQQQRRANDAYEHLFSSEKPSSSSGGHLQPPPAQVHPGMQIFKMPPGHDSTVPIEEFERQARERDRKAYGRKQKLTFFEQVKQRLAGPVKFLPGRGGEKRAKSLDDYEPHLEETVSVPQSRDQSQHRYGDRRKGSHQFGTAEAVNQQQQHLTVVQSNNDESASPSAGSTVNLIQQQQHEQDSPRTFGKHSLLYPQGQLVLELIGTQEEGPRFYAIPVEVANEPAVVKLMQSGKKLHIQANHTFVAVKSRGRVTCSVCNKRIGGNFSNRQAYQCRDCRLVCHKSCHKFTPWNCEHTNLHNLRIEEVDWDEFLRHHQLREFISIGNL